MFCLADETNGRRWRWRINECSCCTCCVRYDRLSIEDVLVITSCTARARQIFISSIHFPKKSRLGQLCRFSAQWIWLHGNSCVRVRSMIDFCRFQSKVFRTSTSRSEKIGHDFNHDFLHSGTYLLANRRGVDGWGLTMQRNFGSVRSLKTSCCFCDVERIEDQRSKQNCFYDWLLPTRLSLFGTFDYVQLSLVPY